MAVALDAFQISPWTLTLPPGRRPAGQAGVAVSATGIAGPGGATESKPVGLVYLGWASRGGPSQALHHVFPGDRAAIRRLTVSEALRLFKMALA